MVPNTPRYHLFLALAVFFLLSKCRGPTDIPSVISELDAAKITFLEQEFITVDFDPTELSMELVWKDREGERLGSFGALKKDFESEDKNLLFATNAGIFSSNFTPGGLHIEGGRELSPLNLKNGKGNFHLMPNGVFCFGEAGPQVMKSADYESISNRPLLATQSGPMLLIDGRHHPAFTPGSSNKYIRSGVGVGNDGRVYFAISRKPVNFYDFASLFKNNLGCDNALYLDGAISRFYLPQMEMTDLGGDFVGMFAISKQNTEGAQGGTSH